MRWMTLEFPFGAADTVITVQFPQGCPTGVAKLTKVKIPDFAAAPTITADIYDSVQDKVYSKAAIPDAVITLVTDQFPIVPGGKCVLTATAAPGSIMSCFVTFFVWD